MGSHSKTAHKPGAIAPAQPYYPVQELLKGNTVCLNAADLVYQLVSHCKEHPAPDGPLTGWYEALTAKAEDTAQAIASAEAAGGSADAIEQMRDMLQLAVSTTLSTLPKEQLIELATAKGFEHPALAALGDAGPYPLSHWLDPTYAQQMPSKLDIQAKALERYAALCAGDTIAGIDLAALQALEGTSGLAVATWDATPADIDEVRAQLHAAASSVNAAKGVSALAPAVAGLIAAENRLSTAACPAYDGLDTIKEQAASEVTEAIDALPLAAFEEAIAAGQDQGLITAQQAAVLPAASIQLLLRHSADPGVRAATAGTAAMRNAQLAALQAAHSKLAPFKAAAGTSLSLSALGPDPSGTGVKQVTGFAIAADEYVQARSAVTGWSAEIPDLTGPDAAPWLQLPAGFSAQALRDALQSWGKKQDPAGIQQAAAALGLDHAEHASKVQALKYIASLWDPSVDASAIQVIVTAGFSAKASTTPPSAAYPATASAQPPVKISSPAVKSATGFAAKHKQLVAALAHVKATTADLPPHIEASAVTSFEFGKGKAAVLGGMHAKTIHTGPDGGNWLFKPDKQARGARAHAEAAASALLHAGGVPSVPVYAVTIGGKPGAVQPLVHGATQLDPSPSSWTQAEADAIVRYHVAAWLAGDHDGKPDNVLRTPSGGLVPIDQGQAFKFYGTDTLDMSFHPNATYGAERPVYHQLYEAHQNGTLGHGVTINPLVAHPVIKQYEKMPDAQLRAILHDTAYQGAASGVVAWIPAMRARAAKQYGVSEAAVTKTQMAEAFLDHACERKHALRAAFADFFTTQVKLPAAAALRHGG